ncbi:MAG: hypothetical protein AB7F67_20840 [Rhodospirillaceae bacterium]
MAGALADEVANAGWDEFDKVAFGLVMTRRSHGRTNVLIQSIRHAATNASPDYRSHQADCNDIAYQLAVECVVDSKGPGYSSRHPLLVQYLYDALYWPARQFDFGRNRFRLDKAAMLRELLRRSGTLPRDLLTEPVEVSSSVPRVREDAESDPDLQRLLRLEHDLTAHEVDALFRDVEALVALLCDATALRAAVRERKLFDNPQLQNGILEATPDNGVLSPADGVAADIAVDFDWVIRLARSTQATVIAPSMRPDRRARRLRAFIDETMMPRLHRYLPAETTPDDLAALYDLLSRTPSWRTVVHALDAVDDHDGAESALVGKYMAMLRRNRRRVLGRMATAAAFSRFAPDGHDPIARMLTLQKEMPAAREAMQKEIAARGVLPPASRTPAIDGMERDHSPYFDVLDEVMRAAGAADVGVTSTLNEASQRAWASLRAPMLRWASDGWSDLQADVDFAITRVAGLPPGSLICLRGRDWTILHLTRLLLAAVGPPPGEAAAPAWAALGPATELGLWALPAPGPIGLIANTLENQSEAQDPELRAILNRHGVDTMSSESRTGVAVVIITAGSASTAAKWHPPQPRAPVLAFESLALAIRPAMIIGLVRQLLGSNVLWMVERSRDDDAQASVGLLAPACRTFTSAAALSPGYKAIRADHHSVRTIEDLMRVARLNPS